MSYHFWICQKARTNICQASNIFSLKKRGEKKKRRKRDAREMCLCRLTMSLLLAVRMGLRYIGAATWIRSSRVKWMKRKRRLCCMIHTHTYSARHPLYMSIYFRQRIQHIGSSSMDVALFFFTHSLTLSLLLQTKGSQVNLDEREDFLSLLVLAM